MRSNLGVRWQSKVLSGVVRSLAPMAAAAAISCAESHATTTQVETGASELALLMADEALPSEMTPVTPPAPELPPRFCSATTFPGGPVPAPPPGLSGPVVVGVAGAAGVEDGGTGAAGAAGSSSIPNGPDPACATVPIGQWTFDDCNSFQTELFDSSFQGHAAFRTVDLACAAGQQGMAVSFSQKDDLVYVPDQPIYGLDFGVTIAAFVRPDSVTGTQTLFRKRDDGDSAFALVLTDCKYQFILRLTSGRLVQVSAPAKADSWQHVAATYDGSAAKLYLDGVEVASVNAPGTLVRGVGPLLMGNDGSGRRFHGRIDNVWFNTLAAPAATINSLLCLRSDPVLHVSPEVGPTVPAGTPVTFSLLIEDVEDARCTPISLQVNASSQTRNITVEPSFLDAVVGPGSTQELAFTVTSAPDTEAGSYPLDFFVFNSSSFGVVGPVGPVVSAPASSVVVGTAGAAAPSVNEAMPAEDPIRPPPTGFAQTQAQYVVAEPTGCHVSSQRELMIRDVSVVEDPVRTVLNGTAGDPSDGVWSFGGLMQRLSPTAASAADNAEQMFRSFLTPQTVNTFTIPERTPMEQLVLSSWPRTPDGKLDLARAPLRLLAITHRLDLTDLKNGKAGEGRFTFGVLDPMGFPMEFTVIFEYMLQAQNEEESRAWIDSVHALQDLPFPSAEYNTALQALTDRYAGRGVRPDAPNGSALIDIRTNEIALSIDGRWQLREFRIDAESGAMAPHTIFQTPDRSFNDTEALGRWVNANEEAILAETHETPAQFEGVPFAGAAVFNDIDFWDAPGIANPEARHKFSLNTCNGCHGQETQTPFLQINPRLAGEASVLSGFLTGISVSDPVTGVTRKLNELARRRGLLEAVICN